MRTRGGGVQSVFLLQQDTIVIREVDLHVLTFVSTTGTTEADARAGMIRSQFRDGWRPTLGSADVAEPMTSSASPPSAGGDCGLSAAISLVAVHVPVTKFVLGAWQDHRQHPDATVYYCMYAVPVRCAGVLLLETKVT